MSGNLTTPPYTNVEVNLNVAITAEGELQLLSQPIPAPTNVVCATETLAAAALYDISSATPSSRNALIEFWEDGVDEIKAQLANSANGSVYDFSNYYKRSALLLAQGLQKILCGEMNANKTVTRLDESGASVNTPYAAKPFVGTIYGASGSVDARNHIFNHFGRMALACYAHHIMGHQQATAAISNDKAFMASMLSLTSPTEAELSAEGADAAGKTAAAAALYARYTHKAEVENSATDVHTWTSLAGSKADADLARRLVGKILDVNLDAAVAGVRSPKVSKVNEAGNAGGLVAEIVDQVIGRDASRGRNEDNSVYAPNMHGLLRFYAGDVLFVNIKLLAPDVKITTGQLVPEATLEALFPNTAAGASTENDTNYTIRIVLA